MISAVIIVLREVLEAMLVICLLLASASAIHLHRRSLSAAVLLGLTGAVVYALLLEELSQWFDGVGQEIINATLLLIIAGLLVIYCILALRRYNGRGGDERWFAPLLVTAVALAMVREGAEIYIYVYAFGLAAGQFSSVLSGSAIGAGIGVSLGTFIYFGMRALLPVTRIKVSSVLFVLMASGLIAQAINFLIQADLLPAQLPIWDSSHIIDEASLSGEFLQAMLGYEANPTELQLAIYLLALLIIAGSVYFTYKNGMGRSAT